MNILFVSTWFPYPLDTGSRIRVHYLLRALSRNHAVHLLAFAPGRRDSEGLCAVARWCEQVDVVQRDPFQRNRLGGLVGYLSLRPRDVVATYSSEMAELVSRTARRCRYDLVIASVANVAPYVVGLQGIPQVLEEHNFMTAWMEEQYRSEPSVPLKVLRRATWWKCRRYERWLYPRFDACTMVSDRDRRALLATISGYKGRVDVIPNGVDLDHNRPGLAKPAPETLVFNGALTYSANANAMRFFLGDVLPLVRIQRPAVTLRITGGTDGVDLQSLPLDEGVKLTGFLDDVRPAVAGSWACVVPLRIGGGTRLKILEAMALGTPVVSTSKGAEGLAVTPNHDILIADTPAAFATQTVRLLGDPALRDRLAHNGRRLVEARYGWQAIGARFREFIEQVATGEAAQVARAKATSPVRAR